MVVGVRFVIKNGALLKKILINKHLELKSHIDKRPVVNKEFQK